MNQISCKNCSCLLRLLYNLLNILVLPLNSNRSRKWIVRFGINVREYESSYIHTVACIFIKFNHYNSFNWLFTSRGFGVYIHKCVIPSKFRATFMLTFSSSKNNRVFATKETFKSERFCLFISEIVANAKKRFVIICNSINIYLHDELSNLWININYILL